MKAILSIDPVKIPLTGIGRYTYELAKGLKGAGLTSLQFLRGGQLLSDVAIGEDEIGPVRSRGLIDRVRRNPLAGRLYGSFYYGLQSFALKGKADHVFHGPNYYVPEFLGASVVTIHDLSTFRFPEFHPRERVTYLNAQLASSLKRVSAIITDSDYMRQEVAKFFSWPLDRIFAIPLACDAQFKPRPPRDLESMLAPLGLAPNAYTLNVGTIEPRKNVQTLLDAYERLPIAQRHRFPLVIAGDQGWHSEALHTRIQRSEREGWLKYFGYFPNESLPYLMAGARIFSYPSLYEGFGLPIVEAMASGIPVICSNASTLPEVAGDAASYHAPLDSEALTELLKKGLEDDEWRHRASVAGLRKASQYSWLRCVRETVDIYRFARANILNAA